MPKNIKNKLYKYNNVTAQSYLSSYQNWPIKDYKKFLEMFRLGCLNEFNGINEKNT